MAFGGRVPEWLIGRRFLSALFLLAIVAAGIVLLLLRSDVPGNV